MRLAVFAAALVTLAVVVAAPAHAQRATQLAPDDVTVLVNKRLGQQQWAIVIDLELKTVIGNVFNLDGSDPVFLYCTLDSPSVSHLNDFIDATVEITCSVAVGCTAIPECGGASWADAGTRSIPGSFFLPPTGPIATVTPTPIPMLTATPIPQRTPVCGDFACDDGETHANCPTDCVQGCGDHFCQRFSENCVTCPTDCGPCQGVAR